ncbi:hypothetical protein J7M00_08425 [bacterium]|nr:hypothetical protein [bacterium]
MTTREYFLLEILRKNYYDITKRRKNSRETGHSSIACACRLETCIVGYYKNAGRTVLRTLSAIEK